ncbi:glycosyltransferase [Desulfobulbus oligotrophicus]|uniref:Glycosyltransferase n=1 Tax=Desulfobulbus oligotrophicus TaxID=1909699 RepID=A0A7T6AQW8_9BACT|nr:glycosyltransferase [Desulfobulbus oligotrophicus]QQG65898.1 glycosyltransferase [Desulfobulbus oligotrophicus]
MKPKLLVVTSTFPRWLNDTDPPFVYELSRRLVRSFDVTVHTPCYHGALASEWMDGVHIHRFRYFFSPFERLAGGQGIVPKIRRNKLYFLLLPFFLAAQLFSLIFLINKIRPDVIHAHWLIPQGFWAVLVGKFFNIPVVITAHGADVFGLRAPVFLQFKKWVMKNADRIVTVSSPLADVLRADTKSHRQPDIIPMGVDSSLFSPEKKSHAIKKQYGIDGPFLLFVGRLTEKKGVRYLIDAMSFVIKEFPSTRLLIVGHGELEQELRDQVKARGLEKVVLFAGGVANTQLPAYYATADIFIGPSVQVKGGDTEGFGLTFVEAAMSGCLVIGTKVGGIEDIIRDDQNGFLVKPGDVCLLAEKIITVISGLENFEEMRGKVRQLMTVKYDWNVISEQYSDLIKTTIYPSKPK